jgi:hypothetical protein
MLRLEAAAAAAAEVSGLSGSFGRGLADELLRFSDK